MDKKTQKSAIIDGFSHSLRDPLWGDIRIDRTMKGIISTRAFQNLSGVRQNGPTCNIYPGAVHTRLAHSLGVYNMGRKILISLLENDSCPFTVTGERSFLAACLLHDIGHFPYAHSLKELSMKTHEELAGEIIEKDEELKEAIINAGATPQMVKAIIDENLPADEETEIYRGILSGAIDPDKLDYLNRDASFCGVPYGSQDNSYIINALHLVNGKIAIEREAYTSIENMLFSKYLMYRSVYWHKGVRSATCMIKKALLSAMRDEIIKVEDLYFLDDAEFNQLAKRDYEPFILIKDVKENRLLARVWEKDYREDGQLEKAAKEIYSRFKAEKEIFTILKEKYPALLEYQIVIDIPEPISFEANIDILNEDGTTEPFSSVTKLFSKDVVKQFSTSLRNIAIFAPSYIKREDIEKAIKEWKRK